MNTGSKIYIAGHTGLVGSSILRKLKTEGYNNLIFHTRKELNLCDHNAVSNFFQQEKPDCVILCAAKVGGVAVHANEPFDVLYENLQIQNNIIGGAYHNNVQKLIFLASGTIYPSICEQPIQESSLFQGSLDSLHESNGLAKICGLKLCEKAKTQSGKNFLTLVPTNIYGIGDSFEEGKARVIGALIARFHLAKIDNIGEVVVWGSGDALREFLYADDLADAILFFMLHEVAESHINIGTDQELSIREIAMKIKSIVGYTGNIVFDATKPEGRLRRKLDTKLAESYGWKSQMPFDQGLHETYQYYLSHVLK